MLTNNKFSSIMKEETKFNIGSLIKTGCDQYGVITSIDEESGICKMVWTNSFQEKGMIGKSDLASLVELGTWKYIWRTAE